MRRILALLLLSPLAGVAGAVAIVRVLAGRNTYELSSVPRQPVALVLGAQVFPDGTPSPFLAARLELARQLYLAGRVDALLLSGDAAAPEYDEPTAMRNYLQARGVPVADLRLDPRGQDTYASCWRARHVYGFRSMTVVTQSYHLPRALGTARALGIAAVGVGDTSVRKLRSAWVRGWVRDQLACVKTLRDVTRHRVG